jgi:thiopurine S-methyltransferase
MDTDFWLQRWHNNEIGFHQQEANAMMVEYFEDLSLERGSRVFVPLCGKTIDMPWLLSRGYQVVGVELSKLAVEQFFAELGVEPQRSKAGELTRYSATDIDIFLGDLFALTGGILGRVDAIYDRAALVALPEAMRRRYAAHLMKITRQAPQFLITFDYDQSLMEGPPFSVSADEVHELYDGRFDVTLAESRNIPGGLKGKCPATEDAWLLRGS